MVTGYRPTPSGGGTERHVFELSRELLEMGIEVEIACEDRPFLPDPANPLEPNIIGYPARGAGPANDLDGFREKSRRIAGQVDLTRYDIIHCHGQFGFELFHRSISLPSRPALVSTFHLTALGPVVRYAQLGLPEPREAAIDRATSLMEESIARLSDACIAVSEGVAAELVDLYLADPRSVRHIPDWYDPRAFREHDRWEARKVLGLEPEGKYLLYIGHLRMSRGDILREALRQLPDSVVCLVLHHQRDDEVIRDLGPRVEFRGQVAIEQMPLYYSAADLLCFPSLYAGFGLVLVEAMACGLPCVAFNYPAMNEVITAQSGYLVDEATAAALARAICQALADGRSRKSQDAISRAKHFALARQIERVVEVYEEAVGKVGRH